MTTYRRCEAFVDYLASDNAPSISQLQQLTGVKNAQQLRHWRDGFRRPNPKHAVALEKATKGRVPRSAFYSAEECKQIWPGYRAPQKLGAA